jgi:hypothetical protein
MDSPMGFTDPFDMIDRLERSFFRGSLFDSQFNNNRPFDNGFRSFSESQEIPSFARIDPEH